MSELYEKSLEKLELDRVLEMLAERAGSERFRLDCPGRLWRCAEIERELLECGHCSSLIIQLFIFLTTIPPISVSSKKDHAAIEHIVANDPKIINMITKKIFSSIVIFSSSSRWML